MSTPRTFLLRHRGRSWDGFNPANTWRPASATHTHMGSEYQPCSWSDLLFLEPYGSRAASLHWASCLVLRPSELFKSCDYLLKKERAPQRPAMHVKESPVLSAHMKYELKRLHWSSLTHGWLTCQAQFTLTFIFTKWQTLAHLKSDAGLPWGSRKSYGKPREVVAVLSTPSFLCSLPSL